MILQVKCSKCSNKILLTVNNYYINQEDQNMYSNSTGCNEHGSNIFEYDEEGNLLNYEVFIFSELE